MKNALFLFLQMISLIRIRINTQREGTKSASAQRASASAVAIVLSTHCTILTCKITINKRHSIRTGTERKKVVTQPHVSPSVFATGYIFYDAYLFCSAHILKNDAI